MDGVCAYCMNGLDYQGAPHCPTCEARHHLDCWRVNGGCAVFGCASAPPPTDTTAASPLFSALSPGPPSPGHHARAPLPDAVTEGPLTLGFSTRQAPGSVTTGS